jgi:integrase
MRNTHHDATFKRDKTTGRWTGRITVDGRRYLRRGRTREQVVAKIAELRAALASGLEPEATTHTVRSYMERWFRDELHNVTARTAREYQRIAETLIYPTIGEKRLVDLKPADVNRWVGKLLKEPVGKKKEPRKPDSVRNARAVLSRALSDAVENGLVETNVVSATKGIRLNRQERVPLDEQQLTDFFAAIRGHRLEALWLLMAFHGLRHGEALALRWGDLDIDGERPSLRVAHTIYRAQLNPPKNRPSRRAVALSPTVVEAMRHHRARQAIEREAMERRLSAGESRLAWLTDPNFVFRSVRGRHLNESVAAKELRRVTGGVAIPRVYPHLLRHTSVTMAIRAGLSPKLVQGMLGHASTQMTLSTYAHLFASDTEIIAAAMEERIGLLAAKGSCQSPPR